MKRVDAFIKIIPNHALKSKKRTMIIMNKKAEIKNRIDLINRGEVPEGYKKVHGYIIPNDWNIVPIKRLQGRLNVL